MVAIEALVRMEERQREDPWFSGGHAVFRTLVDVLDLDSAYAVVPRPGAEHEFTARLSEQQARRLTALIELSRATQQAGPVEGHQHFALFNRTEDAADRRNAYSVIRSTVDSWPQKWEMFLRHGEWLPALRPSDRTPLLPLTAADLAAVTASLMSGEHRYLEVRSRETGPVALLRLTGTAQARPRLRPHRPDRQPGVAEPRTCGQVRSVHPYTYSRGVIVRRTGDTSSPAASSSVSASPEPWP